jgi:two-component system, OmpR family, sensor histidine kinase VicK
LVTSSSHSSFSPIKNAKERTEVVYGIDNVINIVLQFLSQTNNKIDACVDYTRPSLAIDFLALKNAFLNAKKRGVKRRYVTEITKDNVSYCKQLLTTMVYELRHLDGMKGNFYISESAYLAPATFHEKGKPASQIIYSNVKEIVEHQRYVFDSFWNRAVPAKQRIEEIEKGTSSSLAAETTTLHYETRIIDNSDEIIKEISRLTASSSELATCLTSGGMQYSHKYFFDIKKKLLDKQKKGEHKGIRYVTNIDNVNVHLAKLYLDYGIQIKHVKNLPPMSFGISDKEIAATIEKMEEGKTIQNLLISNESVYVKHFTAIFEELWRNGIDAKSRIEDIDNGVDSEGIEIIQNPYEIQKLTFELAKSATKEMLIIFSTANAFHRQEYAGLMQLLKEVAIERGVKIRILVPKDDLIEEKVQRLRQQSQFYQQVQRQEQLTQQIDIRYIEQHLQTKVSVLVVDSKYSLVVELKDDTKKTSYKAIGLATYSNSKSTVLSYVSIFESLWKQTELYQKLSELYEQLQVHDKMQKDFINIAAHELRTPIQPILSITGILKSKINDNEQNDLFDIITRNAKRLQQLTEDILDVTRIESHTLELKNESFSINDIITNIVQDYISQIERKNNKFNLKILYEPKEDSNIFVQADKGRIIQVISNLIDNAIKFTAEGIISITVERIEEDRKEDVVITIKDTGTGIDPEIMPKLFSKFVTKSISGTGLGLFISKSIIEAHGGRIWAQHNPDRRGATFSFSLPINSMQNYK